MEIRRGYAKPGGVGVDLGNAHGKFFAIGIEFNLAEFLRFVLAPL